MDQPGPSPAPPQSSAAENPIVAVGRKVKSALSSDQRPSVRILRRSPSHSELRRVPVSKDFAEKPLPSLPPREAQGPENWPSKGDPSSNRFVTARKSVGASIRSLFSHGDNTTHDGSHSYQDEYDTETVDILDVVDPEVATLSTLTNVQNSLFVPSLGKFVNRQATYRLSENAGEARTIDRLKASLKRIASPGGDEKGDETKLERPQRPLPKTSTSPVKSKLNSPQLQYAILPDGETLPGWTHVEEAELDDMVRHVLHSRRAKMKRSMKGFLQYVRRPFGLFITVYATLITLFGAAWVLFLIGWISLGSKKSYVINIVDNVLVALFAIIGDGLAPFRAVDTYHMIYIARYHRETWKRREKLGLPDLADHNDLPDQRREDVEMPEVDLESLVARRMPRGLARRIAPRIPARLARRIIARSGIHNGPQFEYSVLTEEEQAKLDFHERKFSKSHTFYKPHETETHYAFPLKLLMAVVILLDFHSALQISLGACTWGINYKKRPFALTTVILCCSITCNIMGGVLISIGDKRTRKKDVIERMMRQEITSEAIDQMETRWMKEAEERGEIDKSVRKKHEEDRDAEENEEIKTSWKNVPSLPKVLLGKGEDHRQPSLPQKARRSSAKVNSASSSSSNLKSKQKSSGFLSSLQETPTELPRPQPALRSGDDPLKEGMGQKAMRFIRRADLDRS